MTIAELIIELQRFPDHSKPAVITAADFGEGGNVNEILDDIRTGVDGEAVLGATALMC